MAPTLKIPYLESAFTNVTQVGRSYVRYDEMLSMWGLMLAGSSHGCPDLRDTQAYPFRGSRGAYYNGTIGYTLIYNRALSDSEAGVYLGIRDEMSSRAFIYLPGPRVNLTPDAHFIVR